MKYKVCILAAGAGTRMGELSNHINKAVLPINFKAILSHIIEKFPADIETVVAVGHKKETVIDYLMLAYPERKFSFVEVDRIIGPGTGPGYSLLQCKSQLQTPFIFCAADTIVLEEIPIPDYNWFGIAPVKETERYCTVKIKNNLIYQLDDKTKNDNKYAFIGLAGVKDYETFFHSLESNKVATNGEIQVSNGFNSLIDCKLVPVGFTWFDTGTMENYGETNQNLSGKKSSFDFSKGKGDEFFYFVNDRVIKFFSDEAIAKHRYERANDSLQGLCPKIEGYRGNFFSYKKIPGQTLYSVLNSKTVRDFLQWTRSHLWKNLEITPEEHAEFRLACKKFYYEKTVKRLDLLYRNTDLEDIPHLINGNSVPTLKEMFESLDWDYITNGTPSNFHGDLQFDNVLVTRDVVSNLEKFVLIDWRQDFGGSLRIGDLYYDLAKLYGGMTISYQLIKDGMFNFDISGSSVYYNFFITNELVEAKSVYEAFIERCGYDLKKVRLITALIFLNMAPMHHGPFDQLLYFLGKNTLYKLLSSKSNV